MTTILQAIVDGKPVGQCDKKCYDAHGKTCHCICGGTNHGVGRTQALLNTAAGIELTYENLTRRFCDAQTFYLKARRHSTRQTAPT